VGGFAGDYLETVRKSGEAHFAGDFFAELDEGVGGEGDDFSGVDVEQMVVSPPTAADSATASGAGAFGGIDEIVMGLLAGAEVDLLEKASVEEMLERAVNGSLGSADRGFAEFQEKFFGFEGTAKFLDGFENGEALGGVLELSLAEEVAEEVLGGLHDAKDKRKTGKYETPNIKHEGIRRGVAKSSGGGARAMGWIESGRLE
jgi:hypothetical protein